MLPEHAIDSFHYSWQFLLSLSPNVPRLITAFSFGGLLIAAFLDFFISLLSRQGDRSL